MSEPNLTSIPLPLDIGSKRVSKKSAKEMLQEALRDHKQASKKEPSTSTTTASNKLATALGPKIKMSNSKGPSQSNQSIVDELFKDFIAQKLSSTGEDTCIAAPEQGHPQRGNLHELSKILDLEISSIQSQKESVENCDKKSLLASGKHHSLNFPSKRRRSRSRLSSPTENRQLGEISGITTENKRAKKEGTSSTSHLSTAEISLTVSVDEKQKLSSGISVGPHKAADATTLSSGVSCAFDSETCSSHDKMPSVPGRPPSSASASLTISGDSLPTKETNNIPTLFAKKVAPKLLGMKLSSESVSLIKSTDRIDRDGRVWEEGEVQSDESGKDSAESDSESDANQSETGSINSNPEKWKTHKSKRKKKHKHKHRHKKKKKKSSKEQDSESPEKAKHRDSKHKDRDKVKNKEKSSSQTTDKKTVERERDRGNSNEEREDKKSIRGQDRYNQEKKKDRISDKSDGGKQRRNSERHAGSRDKSRDKSPERSQKQSKKMEETNSKRKRSHSRSNSPKRHRMSGSRSRSHSSSPRRNKKCSSNERSHHDECDAHRYSDSQRTDGSHSHSHLKGKSSVKCKVSRDRSRSREHEHKMKQEKDLRLQIDKAKLRKIAIANALQNMKSGQGPRVDLTALKSGGKSVQELTEFCKKISEKSQDRQGSECTDSSDEEIPGQSDDEDLHIHHPFKVKDTSSSNIVMNIRNAKQLPVLTPSEKQAQQAALRLAFPVSSGSHHRASESEWVPVERTTTQSVPSVPSAPVVSPQAVTEPPAEAKKPDSIFPDQSGTQKIDISSIISERLQAVRKLQENPYDVQALSKMHQVQEQASKWATSKHLPGQFVGSTGANVLSQEELIGDKRHQAWAKKTQLSQAAPVNGGIGMFLLQKMGWKHGEGLGKNNEGSKEPLVLDVKVDRKGLTTSTEGSKGKINAVVVPRAKDLSNKHPVSALMELCNRRRWNPPVFTVVEESGPDHKKNFLFKVRVNNIEYQPCVPSSNKKTAKAQCAAVCLQEMGLIPRDAPLNI